MRALRPEARVYAAEPENAAPLQTSLDGRARRRASRTGAARGSTAPAASRCCRRCGRCVSEWVDESIVVPLDDAARGDAARGRALPRDRRRRRRAAPSPPRCSPQHAAGRAPEDRRRRLRRQHRSRRASRRSPALRARNRRTVLELVLNCIDRRASASPPVSIDSPNLPRDLWWTWNPAREVFRRLDYALWRQTAHNPVMMLQPHLAGDARARPRRPGVPRDRTTRRDRAMDAARAGRGAADVVAATRRQPTRRRSSPTSAPSSRCTSRCRSTPAASACSPATTARKPATSACRSSASGSCIRRATSGSASRPRAGSRRSTSRSTGTTRRSRTRGRVDDKPCVVLVPLGNRIGARAGVGSPARPRAAAAARHRPRAERAVGSRAVRAALRRRPGHAAAAGNRARPRRRAGAARARPHAGRVAPERRPRRVRRAAAAARLPRRRDRPGSDALAEVRRTTVFTTHTPVPAGHDAFPFHLVEQHLVELLGIDERPRRAVPRARHATTTGRARSST